MGKSGRPANYDRINQQQKFKLFYLVSQNGLSVKQAATRMKINYSTAKTIMFFFRKNFSSPSFFSKFSFSSFSSKSERAQARVQKLEINDSRRIQIVSSVGGADKEKGNKQTSFYSSEGQKNIKIEEQF